MGAVAGRRSYGKCRMKMIIRNEIESDAQAIAEITQTAFATCPYGDHTEQFIINALRAAGALTVSLVAEIDRNVVGHVAFSPVTISDGNPHWYGLGPVSVLPQHQRQGIGTALIREGLARAWRDDGSHRAALIAAEEQARASKTGCLWSRGGAGG